MLEPTVLQSGPIEWTLSLADDVLTASDDMGGGPGDLPTFVVGEALTFTFFFGREDTDGGRDILLGYADHARGDNYDLYAPISGPPMYRDQSPDQTLLVGIDARRRADGSPVGPQYPRLWGVLDAVVDASPDGGAPKIEMDVLALARRDDYPDRAAVRSALEADGPAP